MSFPRLYVDVEKIRHNTAQLSRLCDRKGIEIMGVTKGVCGFLPVAKSMLKGGVRKLGDSRMKNIMKMRQEGLQDPIYLLRLPMLSEIGDVVIHCDGSLNSEVCVVEALSKTAKGAGKTHKIILMVDVGDLREGVMPGDVLTVTKKIMNLPALELEGLGTNFGCYGGVLASFTNTKLLVDLSEKIEKCLGIKLRTLSGGNSSTIPLLEKGNVAPGINQFRIGEAILLGKDPSSLSPISGTYQDAFTLEAEVIEIYTKPSLPLGEVGRNVQGKVPRFEDRGPRVKAIVALGTQDGLIDGLIPKGQGIQILGATSDHMILDITDAPSMKVGSTIGFDMEYRALMTFSASNYVAIRMV